jgi:hypothetical protein|tara:strand:+ start:566 stop:835 length:270 start_codon:yes stop_codon:yes gene_type:complete
MLIEEIKSKLKNLTNSELKEVQKHLSCDSEDHGVLDSIQEKVVSRKLLVFGVATALLWYAGLDPETWGMIAMTYIGGQTAIDFAKVWRG